jgi:hypothetical protein
MAEKGLDKKDLEQIFTGFEKRRDEKFKAFEGRIDLKLKDVEGRVVNQFHIISEGLMDHIKLLAEGHAGILNRLEGVEDRLARVEKENERQHLETRALIKLSFSELDRRLSDLESQVKELQEWRKQIEGRLRI